MLRSLTSAVSGLQNFQEEMDVIGNNIANVNTTGYKSARTELADSFSDTLRVSSGANGTTSGSNSLQVGTGVTTSGISSSYTQGALSRTGNQTDLAVSGDGFFMVRDTSSNAQYATRAGDFALDQNGYLVTNTGERVQGYSDAALSAVGDVKIDATGVPATASPTAKYSSFSVDGKGIVTVKMDDGTTFTRGQILLQKFSDPQALVKEGSNLFSGIAAAGPLGGTAPASAVPGTSGTGSIQAGALELSNVDLANEMANLITTQRAFESNAKIITTSDEMLQTLVNLKR